MDVRRVIAAVTVPVALAVACAAVFILRPVEFKTSLYDVAGSASEALPEAVRGHSSRLVPIIVSSSDPAAARSAADGLVRSLPTDDCASVRYRFDGVAFSELTDLYRRNRSGLVTPRDEILLESAEGREKIARAAVRRYFSSPVPPLFPPEEDPFCLTDSFVTSLPVSFSGWIPLDGVLTARRDGLTYILILLELKPDVAGDPDRLIAFKNRFDGVCSRLTGADVAINACGVPLHTADTAGRCKKEINWLTLFSVVFVAVLSVFVFRSCRWLPLFAGSLGVSATAGAIALFAAFPSVHMVTIVFGTSLLGLVIDYSFHWLLQPGSAYRETRRNLFISFVTTEISLLPLMLSQLPVLRQSAVFLGAGLAAALAYVLTCYPLPDARRAAPEASHVRVPFGFLIFSSLVAAGAVGFSRATFLTDMSSVYRPSAALAQAEKVFAGLSGTSDGSRGFYVVSGDGDLEFLLEREASLSLPGDVPCPSRFLPPFSRRVRNAENVAKLYAEHAERLRGTLGLEKVSPPPPPRPWSREDVPSCAATFLSGGSLVVPSAPPPADRLPEAVRFYQPKKILSEILSELTRDARSRLFVSVAAMFAAILFFCRLRAFRILLPSLAALLSVIGFLGFSGADVTLFHLLACFLLVGMGVDYTLFLHSGGRSVLKPAVCSLLTSVAGFGALLFVSFPVVGAFGFVLAFGLPLVFFCAMAIMPSRESGTEHGASPAGLEVLYFAYRIFGLGFLHFAASCAGFAIWMFSRAVRRASPSPRKVIAFTRSLSDKMVVMTGSSDVPEVEHDGSPDARRFIADVAARRGVFVLSSHCGTVEALAALGECGVTFHAWMEFSRTSVFNRFYLRHAKRGNVVIHPISSFGPETVFTAGDALDRGDCLVMAGDRGFGRKRSVKFGTGEIALSEGAFRFARALSHDVYFVACVSVSSRKYRAVIRRLPAADVGLMAQAYADFLYEVVSKYPDQWFQWEGG